MDNIEKILMNKLMLEFTKSMATSAIQLSDSPEAARMSGKEALQTFALAVLAAGEEQWGGK